MDQITCQFALKDKVAIITGASRGIGESIAGIYAKAGAKIVICSRKQSNIEAAVKRLKKLNCEILGVVANVSSSEDNKRIIKTTMDWAGRVDILVNNAGANPMVTTWADMPESVWDKVFDVNLKAAFMLSQLSFHAWMKKRGGSIINISSVAGFQTLTGVPAYIVSKAALMHMTRCLASEWGKFNIRVNAIAPGLIKTQFNNAFSESHHGELFINSLPVGRIGRVDDISIAALYLASEASSFMTGHTMVIDGGDLIKAESRL
jgi:NAD(P)-dependent dehydrogenase (short-subunit alcohol dehydrogenase family)